jgi:hypothetical protein
MNAPESEPQLSESVCSTPPYFPKLTPAEFLRFTLSMAIRDGFERITVRPGEIEGGYDMVGLYRGEEFGIVGPSAEAAQEFPAILAGLGQPACDPDEPRRSVQGHADGCASGEFVLPVGSSSVRGDYRVRWERGVVAELEVNLPLATEAVAADARRDMREVVRSAERREAEVEHGSPADQDRSNCS